MKFAFIAKHRGIWPVNWMCEALGVSRSGFFAWLTRPQSERARTDAVLSRIVRDSFERSDRTYGARRVWHDVDLFSRRIVGWSMSVSMTARPRRRRLPKDAGAQLVIDALTMALWRRGKPDALLHHSDQGSQYTSEAFQRLLADHGVDCSMSRSGNCWDNAAMESFFSSLKTERVSRTTYRTRDDAKADIFDYIERFYNPKRRHSTIGYLSPIAFEEKMALA